jgi:hypothetical protein
MIKFFKWFFSPSKKELICDESDIYSKIIELENRVAKLEEENVETTNLLYELGNSIDAVDTRIDILTTENWIKKNV